MSLKQVLVNCKQNLRNRYYFKRVIKSQKNNTGKIRVMFIAQLPEIWDKLSSVFELMDANSKFEVYLVIVPQYDIDRRCVGEYGDEKEFFKTKYPNVNIIDAITVNGEVIDLRKYAPHYVFYQRPYDFYLPEEIRTYCVMKYAKVCYIPYSYSCASAFSYENTNEEFFRNVYLDFADSAEIQDALSKIFKVNVKDKIQKFLYVGYPVFDTYLAMNTGDSNGGILWTPRWSFDPRIGGSHFMEYKDTFLALKNKLPNKKIIIRPHPLMWENVVREGLMTEEEVINYKTELQNNNIVIDSNKMMEDTIQESNVLITDFSSIMITYFMTGKPIIYCPFETELNEMYQKLLKGMYIADSWEDIEKYLNMIERGEDVLYNVRQEIIEKELKHLGGGSQRIIKEILFDFNE